MSALFEARGLSKSFPGVRALSRVDFELRPGEVHALMGQNGAGKSTLVRIITGAERADGGEMLLAGAGYSPGSVHEAQLAGVAAVHQEVGLIPRLSVAENLLLGRLPRKWHGIDWRAARARAREMLAPFGLDIDVARPLAEFPVAVRQLATIARAIARDCRVLVLDEPTSSLHGRGVATLFGVVRGLRARGVAIVFITHFLDQVHVISDRITILRNGERVGTWEAGSLSRVELVSQMLGRTLVAAPMADRAAAEGGQRCDSVLRIRGLARAGVLAPLDLEVGRGEVVGFAGLLGSGRTEAAELIIGVRNRGAGTVEVHGRPVPAGSPRAAIDAGLGLCPEDRQADGIIPGLSVADNITLVARRGLARWGFVSRRAERALARRLAGELGVKAANLDVPMRTLSGGNQQKALLARWLANAPEVLILDEPMRGVDVGGKAEIERQIAGLARAGMGVVLISGEIDEIARRSDRAVVFRDRRAVGVIARDGLTEDALVRAMAGGEGGRE
ncbi:MAG: sugar ABC transporter ATP-binding protein [Phycisphaerales bacterium]|nr:sugar ABC transporter ATP-binding protein [Phycisphaerales bacterium]